MVLLARRDTAAREGGSDARAALAAGAQVSRPVFRRPFPDDGAQNADDLADEEGRVGEVMSVS